MSAVDASGNEIAGIRLPAVAAGAAAYTGWNPRLPADGLPDVLWDMLGSRLPARSGPIPPGRTGFEAAARDLVAARFLLEEDAELAVRQALAEVTRD